MQLGEIAEIKTGLVLSRKKAQIDLQAKATYKLLTLKNISDDGMFINDEFESFVSNDRLEQHYFTKKEDILMRLNQPYTAVYIDQDHTGLLIPSYFVIIKVDQTKRVLPQYVAWYLNTIPIKKELERTHAGSRIPSTNQHAIRKLPISIPPISKQKIIMELYRLHQKEKMLYKKLIKEKDSLFNEVTRQILVDTNEEER
ncbi:restriction endonuclease subunit S [Fervidibacillus halotolerans]|uniref:Restriction endonuclease subunit S n=1 Tax=Fervidibacillus halotolerans TaxID=2980027 RepID=A0A9E8LZY0_9BACI|nr:restriction endonuclease subunit S [Fervidibacillus halotolerans]WAA12820.1 restriction endonuclease subunit S [Fervidibacillus halotolerans]